MARGHRLAARPSVTPGDLRGETLVVLPEALAHGFREAVLTLVASPDDGPGLVELAAPESREALLDHLSRHADQGFVGPVSMASAALGGVVMVPMADPGASLALSALWPASGESRAAPLLAAARAVSERQGWSRTSARS